MLPRPDWMDKYFTCPHCGKRGHDPMECPKVKREMERMWQQHEAEQRREVSDD